MKQKFDADALKNDVAKIIAQLETASTTENLQEIKKSALGDEGALTIASKAIGSLEPSLRAESGKALSAIKEEFGIAFDTAKSRIETQEESERLKAETEDVSLFVCAENSLSKIGARHPLQTLQNDVAQFFKSIGWRIASGPEAEAAWFNFDALNFGVDHPARQMQDTFYAEEENIVLRTHTSPVQVRSMLESGAPLYIACPGRVFRTDELDATHTPVFHQCEGLAVDEGLTMADLKGTIDAFAKAMFGPSAKTRLRPSFFPFTEPSAEMDVWYENKKGGPGWIEWGGCGMVNPNVLKSCGLDPEKYTGFAFGMGIERTLMLRHKIQDMHDIVEGDVRFSRQFGMNG